MDNSHTEAQRIGENLCNSCNSCSRKKIISDNSWSIYGNSCSKKKFVLFVLDVLFHFLKIEQILPYNHKRLRITQNFVSFRVFCGHSYISVQSQISVFEKNLSFGKEFYLSKVRTISGPVQPFDQSYTGVPPIVLFVETFLH